MPPVETATGEEMIPCVTGDPKENKSVTVSKIRQGMVKDENYVHTDNNFTTQLKDKLDGISLALKSGNSNVDAEQFNFLTDAINKSTIIPSYFDRENAIKYLDVSDTEFARLTYKGTKFHPVQPLLSPVRVQGMTKPVYLKDTLDALKKNGLIRPKKSRGKYKTKN